MHEGLKLIAGMTAVPVLVIGVLISIETPAYIPSGLLAQAAQENRDPARARKEMAEVLYGCRKRRNFYHEREIGVRFRKIGSWRNDAGWFGRTYIDCADSSSCTVRATAWIPAPRQSESCGWTRRKPRVPALNPAT